MENPMDHQDQATGPQHGGPPTGTAPEAPPRKPLDPPLLRDAAGAPVRPEHLRPRHKHLPEQHRTREHRRRRLRRHGRRAYVRSVYFLPSLATLGNAVCGFAAVWVAGLDAGAVGYDRIAVFLYKYRFFAAAYLIFAAMLFDALDGRLARFTRHTTDFGGQLDSLADVISFGVAPAFLALSVFKHYHINFPFVLTRLIWAVGAVYMCCAAMRLARFNVSNEHGEQHHFSFLGLPSPGAAGAVAALVLMQQDLAFESMGENTWVAQWVGRCAHILLYALPVVVLLTGILMVSNIRYPHVVNRYLRGRKSIARVITVVAVVMLIFVAHRYLLGLGCLGYALSGLFSWAWLRARPRPAQAPASTQEPPRVAVVPPADNPAR
jgi:CDP-diacylglycerol--serine O-phosphatidyltransferase